MFPTVAMDTYGLSTPLFVLVVVAIIAIVIWIVKAIR